MYVNPNHEMRSFSLSYRISQKLPQAPVSNKPVLQNFIHKCIFIFSKENIVINKLINTKCRQIYDLNSINIWKLITILDRRKNNLKLNSKRQNIFFYISLILLRLYILFVNSIVIVIYSLIQYYFGLLLIGCICYIMNDSVSSLHLMLVNKQYKIWFKFYIVKYIISIFEILLYFNLSKSSY